MTLTYLFYQEVTISPFSYIDEKQITNSAEFKSYIMKLLD